MQLTMAMKSKLFIHPPKLREILVLTLLGVLMYVSQVIMSQLPNIEIVSLLIILIARKFSYKAFFAVYVFVGLEVLTYGFSMWVINYLYVWAILCLIVCLLRKIDNVWFYTLLSSIYGLFFGTLCSIPYFLTGGFAAGISYIASGIGYDLLHCFGNGLSCVILYKTLTRVMNKIIK